MYIFCTSVHDVWFIFIPAFCVLVQEAVLLLVGGWHSSQLQRLLETALLSRSCPIVRLVQIGMQLGFGSDCAHSGLRLEYGSIWFSVCSWNGWYHVGLILFISDFKALPFSSLA